MEVSAGFKYLLVYINLFSGLTVLAQSLPEPGVGNDPPPPPPPGLVMPIDTGIVVLLLGGMVLGLVYRMWKIKRE